MINIQAVHAASQTELHAFSCVEAIAAGMPAGSELAKAYDYFRALPISKKHRALQNPEAAARLVGVRLKLKRAGSEGDAWGIVRAGVTAFAVRVKGIWFARSRNGLARVHPSRIRIAYEVR